MITNKELLKIILACFLAIPVGLLVKDCVIENSLAEKDIKQVCSSIPLSDSFIYYRENSIIKPSQGSLKKDYYTALSCKDAKSQIYSFLESNEWKFNETEYGYTKGKYIVAVNCYSDINNKPNNIIWLSCIYNNNKSK
jgi:hypothetical protein